MRRKISEIILITLLMLLTGCATVHNSIELTKQAAYVAPLFKTKECENYTPNDQSSWFTDWQAVTENPCKRQSESITDRIGTCPNTSGVQLDAKECKAYLMRVSDNICNKHLAGIFTNQAASNVFLGILAAGTGIAGGLVPGINAANALSGAAGFLTGSRALINEEVYLNSVGSAIIKEIQVNRETIAKDITGNIVNAASEDGIEQIKKDVSKYHNACSFYTGLSSLVKNAGRSTSSVSRIQARIQMLETEKKDADGDRKKEIDKQKNELENLLLYLGM